MKSLSELKRRREELNKELLSLYHQINEAEYAASPEFRCILNGKEYTSRGKCYGTDLRAQLSPSCAGYFLFLENVGSGPDILLNDSDIIPYGVRVYSVPPAIGA